MSKKKHNKWLPTTTEDLTFMMISGCKKYAENINEWERNFIYSIDIQYLRNKYLSYKQKSILEKIWKSVNVEQGQKKQQEIKSNMIFVQNVEGRSTIVKKKRRLQEQAKMSLVQPMKKTIFYCGEDPPWDN